MLDEKRIPYRYREYWEDPLTFEELERVLGLLGVGPKDVLRRQDKAFKELGLTGDETDSDLISHMVRHPTLLQRPIGIVEGEQGGKAVIGRPVERLLELTGC